MALPMLNCCLCNRQYTTAKALYAHIKTDHGGGKYRPDEVYEIVSHCVHEAKIDALMARRGYIKTGCGEYTPAEQK